MTQQAETSVLFPFSLEQEFLRLQHENDGSTAGFGQRPISSGGWRLTGDLDLGLLQQALDDVVERHEALRTAVVNSGGEWMQEVRPPCRVKLAVTDLADAPSREVAAEHFLNEVESGVFDADGVPLLWAFLGRFDERDAVLVLVAYLPLIDVWSIGVVMRDLADCYAARRRGLAPDLPSVPRYRDHVAEQADSGAAAEKSFAYWRQRLSGARAFALTADHPPAEHPSGTTRVDRFTIEPEVGAVALRLARSMNCSAFMVLFAVHLLQLRRLTCLHDGVVWTLTSGPARRNERLEDTVGYFVNMSPLRTNIAGCATFRDVVAEVRASCVAAYQHEVPFVRLAQEASDIIGSLEQGGMVVPGFAVFQNPAEKGERQAGDLTVTTIRRRLSQAAGPGIPDDAILWTIEVDPEGELLYAMSSSTDRYDQRTADAMVAEFQELFRTAVTAPDTPLSHF